MQVFGFDLMAYPERLDHLKVGTELPYPLPKQYFRPEVAVRNYREHLEAWEIIMRAWTEEVFSYRGKFWSYADVAIWPRPVHQPHPPVWVPVSGSKETIEWAARENIPITPGAIAPRGVKQDIVRYYAECLAEHGYTITPNHLSVGASPYVADSRQQALKEAGPSTLYFFHTLLSHGNIANLQRQRERGYLREAAHDYFRPENRQLLYSFQGFRHLTLEDIERTERACFGSPEEVRDYLLDLADSLGANTLLLNFNQGALPHELFVQNLQRFAKEVLPALKAHEVTAVPVH